MKTKNKYKIIFSAHSSSINLFWNLYKNMNKKDYISKCAFFLTNKHYFNEFRKNEPEFNSKNIFNLKEWEILKEANLIKYPDLEYIKQWEIDLDDGSLWNSLIIDRRLNFHLKAQYGQSYESRYDHFYLLKILQSSLFNINKQIEKFKPDAILGLNAVTLYDYLYYLIAKKQNIPYLQLKLTRIGNYVSWFSNPFDISEHIADSFKNIIEKKDYLNNKIVLKEAKDFIFSNKNSNLIYEGAITLNNKEKFIERFTTSKILKKIKSLINSLKNQFLNFDSHYPNIIYTIFQIKFSRNFRKYYFNTKNIFDINSSSEFYKFNKYTYAFYPLNTEPEVALLGYGRPYRNQIETIRNIASSLPVNWKLVVKEHPNSFGYRKLTYYKKLKQIPNVVLASHKINSNLLIKNSDLVAVVYGTIGLESIILRKPLITFCKTPYAIFSENMVKYVSDPWNLSRDINKLINNYLYDESQLIAFIASHIENGEKINLFTDLLGKKSRHKTDNSFKIKKQYENLASFTFKRINQEVNRLI